MGLFHAEVIFPLIPKLGMQGVAFFDTGQAFDRGEEFSVSDFRSDAGAGIRWISPMGPLRVEYGFKLDPEDGEDMGKFQFSMGAFF